MYMPQGMAAATEHEALVRLSLLTLRRHTGKDEVQLHPFLTPVLDGAECRPRPFYPRETTPIPYA